MAGFYRPKLGSSSRPSRPCPPGAGVPAVPARTARPPGGQRTLIDRRGVIGVAIPFPCRALSSISEEGGAAAATPAAARLPDWQPLAAPALWAGPDSSVLRSDDGASDSDSDGSVGARPATASTPLAALPPAWRLLLLSDGSVTRHLQLLTGGRVSVDVLDMRVLAEGEVAGLPDYAREISGPILQRRVLLRVAPPPGGDGGTGGAGSPTTSPALVFATSWWNVADAAASLPTATRPIWSSLADFRSELFREIRGVEHGGNPALSRAFGLTRGSGGGGGRNGGVPPATPALWGRHYLFHRGGRPLTAIYEVFSPRLGDWLGVGGYAEDM